MLKRALKSLILIGGLISTSVYADDIIISKPEGYTGTGPEQFIIQDRNLWATSNDITSPDSYGYHFQRWNNHGFSNNWDITIIDTQVDASEYGPNNPYSWDAFIKRQSSPYDWSSVKNDNLRWGSGDSASNNRGLDDIEDTATERQGPCNEGYHVPSAGEWSKVLEYWCYNNPDQCDATNLRLSNSLYYISASSVGDNFRSALKIPFAGGRGSYDGSVGGIGGYARLWSSSPGGVLARGLLLFSSNVGSDSTYRRSFGAGVRCFKNSSLSNSSILSLSAMSGDTIASEEVSFSNGIVSYTQSVRDAIQSIREFLQLSEKYIIEWYQTNAQGEKEVVEIESINSTESMALSGQVKKRWMCKPPAHYHGEGN